MASSIENGAPGRNAEDVSGKRIGTERSFFGLAIKQTKAGPAWMLAPLSVVGVSITINAMCLLYLGVFRRNLCRWKRSGYFHKCGKYSPD